MFKIQDYLILGAAFISFLFSVSLWFGVIGPPNKEAGVFVDLWVPSMLSAGLHVARRVERTGHREADTQRIVKDCWEHE